MVNKTSFSFLIVLLITIGFYAWSKDPVMSKNIRSLDDVKALFLTSPDQVEKEAAHYLKEAEGQLAAILAVPAQKRTFDNTARALDELGSLSNSAIKYAMIEMIGYVNPDKAMRDASNKASQQMREFFIDMGSNKKLYEAFKAYVEGNAKKETLNAEQQYFLDETMRDFKRAGLHLPHAELEEVKKIKKELAQLSQNFTKNIAEDNRTITVTRAGLTGLEDEFVDSLKKTEDGLYILGVDYPTYFRVMQHCEVEDTRKKLYEAFMNRAYPTNKAVMEKIIALRDQLAKRLGYESYAQLDIESQMAQCADRAESFIVDLAKRAEKKEQEELALFKDNLPKSVSLTKDGKIKAWDLSFITSQYKKKHFDIDERKIAEYFPMQKTIDELLDIYRQFLGVDFEEVPVSGLWHDDVKVITVFNKGCTQQFGYLFLDLHPRPNKYTHACHASLVPGVQLSNGDRIPTVSLLICNFPKATADKPALLMRSDAKTFFHEFGHALHALLGATQMGSFSGTKVKRDFVELPSQMLEEWLDDKAMLKKVTSHYQTGDELHDETIDKIIALKRFGTGYHVRRQCLLSHISLECFKPGEHKDIAVLEKSLYTTLQPAIEWGNNRNMTSAFGHLTGYGAKYYGYMWSKVFALDLFDTIKKEGLLNPVMGQKYIKEIIGRGGSCDPNELLKNFLGREPKADAFMKSMGFNS